MDGMKIPFKKDCPVQAARVPSQGFDLAGTSLCLPLRPRLLPGSGSPVSCATGANAG
jgi:hypothetical protein